MAKKPRKYCDGTIVSVEKSQNDIRKFLREREAERFGMAHMDGKGAQVICLWHGRQCRFEVPATDDEREERRLWRVLFMRIKLRWEEMRDGEVSFDEAFFPFIVGPDKKLIKEHVLPNIGIAYEQNKVPQLGYFK